MNVFDEDERRKRVDAAERRLSADDLRTLRDDVRELMGKPSGRRVVWGFLHAARYDASPWSPLAAEMAHNVGWRDGAAWWVDLIRTACPEQEEPMRREARERDNIARRQLEQARGAPDGNDDDHHHEPE